MEGQKVNLERLPNCTYRYMRKSYEIGLFQHNRHISVASGTVPTGEEDA